MVGVERHLDATIHGATDRGRGEQGPERRGQAFIDSSPVERYGEYRTQARLRGVARERQHDANDASTGIAMAVAALPSVDNRSTILPCGSELGWQPRQSEHGGVWRLSQAQRAPAVRGSLARWSERSELLALRADGVLVASEPNEENGSPKA